jgi:hypothetical protein
MNVIVRGVCKKQTFAFASRKRHDDIAFGRTGTQADCRPIETLHAHGSGSQQPDHVHNWGPDLSPIRCGW